MFAGVGRAAVVNWRRRHPDFPKPVDGTAESPRFWAGEADAWLHAHGKLPGGTVVSCCCGEQGSVARSPLAQAEEAKRRRDIGAEIGALVGGHRALMEAPWYPSRGFVHVQQQRLSTSLRFWHRPWGVVAERHLGVRL
ncbi:hypothetical protein ACWGRV_37560 [Streptomyces sp. NPDC055663]